MKSRKQIDRLFSSGRSFNLFPLRVVYLLELSGEGDSGLKWGVSVPSRHFKKAIDRNRVKRQLRESWRTQNLLLKQMVGQKNLLLQVFTIYTGREAVDFVELREKMAGVIEKLLQEAEAITT